MIRAAGLQGPSSPVTAIAGQSTPLGSHQMPAIRRAYLRGSPVAGRMLGTDTEFRSTRGHSIWIRPVIAAERSVRERLA